MKKHLGAFALLCWFLAPAVPAATYYVATIGNDGNPGTSGSPWLTLTNAAAQASAGDTVLVEPGVYANTGTITPAHSGSVGSPIIFRANGAVTNTGFSFVLTQPYIIIDGFAMEGGGGITVNPAATHCTVTNCTIEGASSGVFMNLLGGQLGNDLLVSRCFFNCMTGTTYVTIQGTNCIVEKSTFANGASCDALRLFGSNGIIRQCLFTNMFALEGQENHPDIMQTFGDRGGGYTMKDFLFERNEIINCPIQLAQFTMDLERDTSKWGITIRNNVIIGSDSIGSIGIANVKIYNNTWYRCSNATMQYSFTPTYSWAYGGVVKNNAWIECTGNQGYNTVPVGPDSGLLTTANSGGGGRTGGGYGTLRGSGGVITVSGVYSNLSGTITSGMVYIAGGADLYTVDATNFGGGNYYADVTMTFPANGVDYGTQWGAINGHALGFRINTSTFTNGEISASLNGYNPLPTPDLVGSSNYTSGGSTMLVSTNWPKPMFGSILIDAGTDLSSIGVANDFEGNPRPQGASFDIGAFEYSGSGQTSPPPVAPSLTAQPQSASVSAGSTATFSVAATGTAPLNYQWQFNGANITGAASSAFTKNSVQASDAGSYSVVVANAVGSVTSASAVLVVTTATVPPSITAQPQSETVNAGNTATFSVTATGTAPLSYQWRFNGANISGATSSTYARPAVQSGDAGNYSVVVANAAGSVTSASAVLTVTTAAVPPSLTAQPQSETVNAGNTATFSVTATGTAPLSYQWRFNGANISGATSSTYAWPAVQSGDAGNYSVVVANAAGSVTSADAPLTVTSSVGVLTDSSLKLHLDFDEDFSSGQVLDTSGNGNDAWQFNPTNRITPTPGVLGGTAAQFSSPGTYLAVTNLGGFAYLTNGTISVWAKFAPNGDLAMRLLDNGYTPGYSANPAAASNSWALCRDYTPNLTFLVYPSGSAGQRLVSWPDDTVRSGGSQPDLSTASFHLYSVTIDCPNNRAIAYYDGNPWMTNSINLPWIRVYGCAGQPWLCIGAASSDGTPQWGDDAYPGYGFFAGSLDDLRIYNRTLPAADVKALYTGRPAPTPPLALRIMGP